MIEVFDKKQMIEFLRTEDEIANLNMIGAIENIKGDIFNNPKDQLRMFVDNIEAPNGAIVQEYSYWYYVYAKNEAFIYYIKEHFFKDKLSYGFDAVDRRVYDILKEGETLEWEEICELLYVIPSEFKAHAGEYTITDGTTADAEIINDHYTFKDEITYDFILDNLRHRPSSVYRVDGEPVAWVLLHRDNSMGIMYTKKAYRGKNIAFELSMDIISKVIQKGQIPFIHIGIENQPSFILAKKCGFKPYKTIYWFGIKK